MTNCQMLKRVIDESGYTKNYIAKHLNITPQGLYKKRIGETEFTVDEMKKLCVLLKISNAEREKIFLS